MYPGHGGTLFRTVRRMRTSTATLLLALAVVTYAGSVMAGESLTGVRYWTAPDHTRIVVDLTGYASYSTRVLTNPDRVVVLVQSADAGDVSRSTAVGDGVIQHIRINQIGSGAQVVLDLEGAFEHNVFSLKPYLGKPHRIVIDVFSDVVRRISEPVTGDDGPVATRVIVIDPGHGGEDPGTLGNGVLVEKEIVLDIGKRVAGILRAKPGYDVRMTRDGDYFVSLRKRKQLAQTWGGDIFISIHGNSAPNLRASGTEIFYVSPRGASDQAARELADRENAADLVGGVSPDADNDVLSILVDLKMGGNVQKSSHLATMISSRIASMDLGRCSMKQAGFVVLKSLSMPSVLVEVGFLSNGQDVDKLKRPEYRQKYANCLAQAIDDYFACYVPMSATSDDTHTVAVGETLWSIARRYDISVENLRRMNGLPDDGTIKIGQVLSVEKS